VVSTEVVVDDNSVTSRKLDDLPAFNREMITMFAKYHAGKREAYRPGEVAAPGAESAQLKSSLWAPRVHGLASLFRESSTAMPR
jgi:hypothetical protein